MGIAVETALISEGFFSQLIYFRSCDLIRDLMFRPSLEQRYISLIFKVVLILQLDFNRLSRTRC